VTAVDGVGGLGLGRLRGKKKQKWGSHFALPSRYDDIWPPFYS